MLYLLIYTAWANPIVNETSNFMDESLDHGIKRQKLNLEQQPINWTISNEMLDYEPVDINISSSLDEPNGIDSYKDFFDGIEFDDHEIDEFMDQVMKVHEGLEVQESIPQYKMQRGLKTIKEIWDEYTVGLKGQPSIKSLDERYGASWRQ